MNALTNLSIYPNPMTSQGNIAFNLASADNITITIYDMQGNEVKTITMGNQSPGSHLVTFASSGLREGTYFASLTGDNFRKVSKFVVVK
jgi:flagellar hook assembly protein FlgD